MKHKFIIRAAGAIGLTLAASASFAQGIAFDGAYIEGTSFNSYYQGELDYSQTGIYGAAQASYGKFAVQADIGVFTYDYTAETNTYYALHAMYNISPNLVVGGYFGQDLWNSGAYSYSTYGAEAKFTPGFLSGKLTLEAFAGVYAFDPNPTNNTNPMIGLGATYAVTDRIDLGASYLRGAWTDLSDPADQYDVLELEGTYTFASGLFATASYTNSFYPSSNWEDATFGIAVGFTFGDGVTFERRGYSTLYPGD